jgi:hypothetical protein
MGAAKSATMFVLGGLAVAFLGAAGKDGWEFARDTAKQRLTKPDSGTWVTTSATPFFDYVDTYTPYKNGRNSGSPRGWYGTGTDYVGNSIYPDTIVDVYPDSYDFYPIVPKRKKRAAGGVWGDYYPVSDRKSDLIYPESIDYFVSVKQPSLPTSESFVPTSANDRT